MLTSIDPTSRLRPLERRAECADPRIPFGAEVASRERHPGCESKVVQIKDGKTNGAKSRKYTNASAKEECLSLRLNEGGGVTVPPTDFAKPLHMSKSIVARAGPMSAPGVSNALETRICWFITSSSFFSFSDGGACAFWPTYLS